MLVLSRNVGESVMIGDNIRVVVVRSNGQHGQVRIGFEAPTDVPILRLEVYRANKREPPPSKARAPTAADVVAFLERDDIVVHNGITHYWVYADGKFSAEGNNVISAARAAMAAEEEYLAEKAKGDHEEHKERK